MKKFVTLSAVAAVALSLGACAKTAEGNNATVENGAVNDTALVEENATNTASIDNAAEASNVEVAANATNAVEANTTNAN